MRVFNPPAKRLLCKYSKFRLFRIWAKADDREAGRWPPSSATAGPSAGGAAEQAQRGRAGAAILAVLKSSVFVDLVPMRVYTKLLDQGNLCGSPSNFTGAGGKQSGQGTPPAAQLPPRTVPELVATAPDQVFTWDITKLAGPVEGKCFDCYKMVDVHSGFIVCAHVHATEPERLAVEMMKGIFGIHGCGRKFCMFVNSLRS